MVMKQESLNDYIFTHHCIPTEVCSNLISIFDSMNKWEKHSWTTPALTEEPKYIMTQNVDDEEELEVSWPIMNIQEMMIPYLREAVDEYRLKYGTVHCNLDWEDTTNDELITPITRVRINKYSKGQLMKPHFDHIHSIFDGERKGVPVLSFVGALNEEYEGGMFVIRDKEIKIKTGEILIFPSNFLYPHQVTKITMGTRYSFVAWGF